MRRNGIRKEFRLEDGTLPKYAWPGFYPLYYQDEDNVVLCPDCANELEKAYREGDADYREFAEQGLPDNYGINWEDPTLYCDECGKRIESAYAEDEGEDKND